MKLRSFVSLLVLFLLGLTLTASCVPSVNPIKSNPSPANKAALVLGFSAWPGWFIWQAVYEQGNFQKNNIPVDLRWFDDYSGSISALSTGQIDANSQTLNDTISAVAKGADEVVVLVNDNSTGNDKIIVRDGINSIADLKGKKVAAEAGTVDHFLLLLGLQKAGLTSKEIEFVPMETKKAVAAFVAGQVDAVGVFAPFTTQALKRSGSKELFSSRDFPGAISDHLVFARRFVDQYPDRVQAVVNSWLDTVSALKENATPALRIMAKRAGVDVSEYERYAEGTKIFMLEDNLKAFQQGDDMRSLQFAAEQTSKFLNDTGLALTKPNLSKLFDDRFIKAYAARTKPT